MRSAIDLALEIRDVGGKAAAIGDSIFNALTILVDENPDGLADIEVVESLFGFIQLLLKGRHAAVLAKV